MLRRLAPSLGLSSLVALGCVPDSWTFPSPVDASMGDALDASMGDALAPDVDATETGSSSPCDGPCAVSCSRGLVALYRAEGNANDSAGSRHAVATHGVTYVPGRYGRAFDIDGSPDYVSLPGSVSDLEGELTLSLWIKTGHPGRFIARRTACWAVAGFRGFDLGLQGDGSFTDEVFSNGNVMVVTLVSLTNAFDGQWHHVAMVRRGNTIALYVDGHTRGAQPFETDFVDPYSTPVYLGVSRCVAGAPGNNGTFDDRSWFRGAIDEVGFYNRALTDEELGDIAAGRCAL